MALDYSEILETFTNNVLQCLVVIFIVVAVLYLVTRIIVLSMYEGGLHYVQLEKNAVAMQTIHNPFSFEVKDEQASYSGVKCTFSCERDYFLLAVWGVPIYQLFALLHQNPRDLKNSLTSLARDKNFSYKCKSSNDVLTLKGGEEKTMIFKPQKGYSSEADIRPNGAFLRTSYPFVAVMLLQDLDVVGELVIALATVVHLPDEGFPLSPQIIGQHVKTSNGVVCTVKKVYLSSPESSRIGGENIDLCLACYHRAITAVIIPCGHACVCTTCLEFCKNCPVCRGPSHSYFELQTIP
ncbi:cell growth regulator with RING finger domain protein 1 [Trichonephila inaurata madagascariensis]|uniref:Cell growth regulator with RING finger domain protein 1 n=1 Tax=Trichonephila inaurata madagascariensis TaxID=2747483 RepID=A0A8X6XPN5_9ARAC|nr:cell growth regulator with RING finger domain protein 1 [Trichonephila inaurata madagascariensis]